MAAWQSVRGELPPSPDGPLTLEVPCSTGGRARAHPVTLEAGWALTTPHDLAAERILLAFGGTLSCLPLHDVVVPALRELVQLSARRRLPQVTRRRRDHWVITAGHCRRCRAHTFRTASDAARHERSLEHWTARLRPHDRVFARLYDAVGAAHATTEHAGPPASHPLVREPQGAAALYDAGVPLELVESTHAAVWPDGPPLPVALYLSTAYLTPDLAWLAHVARRRPDPDVLTWAAMTESALDRHHPEARLQWLGLGLGTRDVERLMDGGYTIEDATAHAAATGRSLRLAARLLAAWRAAGCAPGPGDVAALDRIVGPTWKVPSSAAVDLLLHDVGRGRHAPTRTQAGLVLAAAGSRPAALRLLHAGVRDPLTVARLLDLAHADG